MMGATRQALLSILLLAVAMAPLGAVSSIQHSSITLGRRQAPSDGSECWQNFAKDPQNCPVVQVAYFQDTECAKPLELFHSTPRALIKDNTQMLFDGAVAHSLKRPFGSLRVVAAVKGIGIGFAKREESDTVVQNMAWLSSDKTFEAYQSKSCVTFPNLDASQVGVWSVKFDNAFNQGGYTWNYGNIPIKRDVAQCNKRQRRSASRSGSQPICLEAASYGGGGVLLLYTTDDCTPDPKNRNSVKKQLYSTVQCSPLYMTGFKSYRAVQPKGPTIDTIFSPVYYDLGQQGYHACSQRDTVSRPFKPDECQRFSGNDMFAGVYGNDPDPSLAQPPPGPGDKILRKALHAGSNIVNP